MKNSLLFIPDISGFTHFVQSTEIEHSQYVIAELLEIIINANELKLELAEIEGDALFFYKNKSLPSLEELISQVERIFTSFYSHLKLFESQRICPCNACSSAIELDLKIVVHCGEIQFMNVNNKQKPFGPAVIEAHRLLKNKIPSDNYLLVSEKLSKKVKLNTDFENSLFKFEKSSEKYDGKTIDFLVGYVQKQALKLELNNDQQFVEFDSKPNITVQKKIPLPADKVFEYISNFKYRHFWVQGPEIRFNQTEVNRVGTEHLCVINQKQLNFTTITKKGEKDELIYGELTHDTPFDTVYQFYVVKPTGKDKCIISSEVYYESNSKIKKFFLSLIAKTQLKSNNKKTLNRLSDFATSQTVGN